MSQLSGDQWLVFSFLFLHSTLGDSAYTLQSTFYPKVAELKNATAFEYTIVLGIFEATMAISSPIFGACKMPSRNLLLAGSMIQGLSVCLFGFLEKVGSLSVFLGGSILLRILEGIGTSAKFVGLYSFVSEIFPQNSIPLCLGLLEMTVPIGFLIGPLLGSCLYELGGFLVPFEVVGGILSILTLVILPITQNSVVKKMKKPELGEVDSSPRAFYFLWNPKVVFNFVVIFGMACSFGVLFSILEPFLRHRLEASQMQIGMIFAGTGLTFSIFTPLLGFLSEQLNLDWVLWFGLVLNLIGSSFIGPLPNLLLEPNLSRTCIALCVYGGGTGIAMFTAYLKAIRDSDDANEKDAKGSNLSQITGLYLCCFSVGTMISNPVSGLLYDNYGFRAAGYSLAGLALILIACQSAITLLGPYQGLGLDKSADGKGKYDLVNMYDVQD